MEVNIIPADAVVKAITYFIMPVLRAILEELDIARKETQEKQSSRKKTGF